MKKTNQDNFIIKKNLTGVPNAWLLSVCDGHGEHGHFVSEFIKKVFPQILSNLAKGKEAAANLNLKGLGQQRPVQFGKLAKKTGAAEPEEEQLPLFDLFKLPPDQRDLLLKTAFKALQEKMITAGKHDSVMSGSTFCTVFTWNDKIICANVGDSRGIVCERPASTGKWRCTPLSRDHKPDDLDEGARIRKRGGKVEQSRLMPGMCPPRQVGMLVGPARVWLKSKPLPGLAMSRSIGDMIVQPVGVIEEPEVFCFGSDSNESSFTLNPEGHKLAEDRFIVVASDGIWDRFSNE